MRLLVITNLFYPDRGGGGSVFSDLCFGLVKRKWEVNVFTVYPYYPEWRRKSDSGPWRIQRENINGVTVWRHGLYVPKEPSRLLPRLLYELSIGLSLLRSLFRNWKADVTLVFCPMIGSVFFAILRRQLQRSPLWLNIQDIPVEAAAASGISRSRLFNAAASRFQNWLFNQADVWSSISPLMVERLGRMRTRNQPIHLCPNWLNESMAECIKKLPSKLGRAPKEPARLLYAGNVGKKQGLLEFCKQITKTKLDFIFEVYASGGEAMGVCNWIKGTSDKRFSFGDFLGEGKFIQALYGADVFVITEKPGVGASFIPSKLIPAIAMGTPVLAVCDISGPLGREMTEGDLGFVLGWSSLSNLTAQLTSFLGNTQRFIQFQKNCLEHAKRYERDFAVDRFDKLLKQLVIT